MKPRGIVFLLAALIVLPQYCPAGEDSRGTVIAANKVAWSDLIFTSSKFPAAITVRMQLESMDGSSASLVSPEEEGWGTCPDVIRDGTMMLTIKATSQVLGAEDRYEERIWFTAQDGLPYERHRLSRGNELWIKSYCWEDQGVRRRKFEPGDPAEGQRSQTLWSQRTESLYRYPVNDNGCSAITDPALIVYKVSSLAPVIGQKPLELCVFGKKQLHRLFIKQEEASSLEVAYTVRSATREETVVKDRIVPLVYTVTSENIAAADQAPEAFSLFGLEKNIRIYLDPEKGIPVRISGTADNIGALDFQVQQATVN
ncbi:hypothetical protein JWG42_07665 [Desulfoprunum benzoelyticum]|uniref:DUF3108 domain-containing protein n=1 Tax=Desulfoprunum benzoelyticum TaxID=1506996 RepID=A0A840V498_9BACT|nr:hypothetical protein [Desulfoprunum benzoelyticum]MBB5348700.1 hypothetical protein [Desulfoprunum benzoelyticum]MBM9530022.1 hypothetical protein [Desulfoprunum benzoelyticum]